MRHSLYELVIVFAVIVGALGKLLVGLLNLQVKFFDMVKGRHHFLFERAMIGELHLLGQVAYGQVTCFRNSASCGALQASNDFEHGRFSCTIFAHQCHTIFLVDDKTHIVKQCLATEFYL
ncbi:Uncharacterised protein [Chlamydia trachomatis]|nr:Uncharacterised protein [Chlamydia trachomatis]